MRIVSTGKFTIDTDNNPRGLKGITIDFNIPENHYQVLAGTSRWWTKDEHIPANQGSASDPIKEQSERDSPQISLFGQDQDGAGAGLMG